MSPELKALRVGAATLASMLLTLVGMSILLVLSDASAAYPCLPVPVHVVSASELDTERARTVGNSGRDWEKAREAQTAFRGDTGSDQITEFAVEPVTTSLAVETPNTTRTAYVVVSKTGNQVFVYTRNADGVLTDPD